MVPENPGIAEWRMYIAGELAGALSGRVFANVNPATEAVIGHTADGAREDFERAIAAARHAFDRTDWSTNVALRVRCMRQLHDALVRHKEDIRALLTAEVGTCSWLTGEMLLDLPIQRFADHAALAESYPYETTLSELDFRGKVSERVLRREAIGVVAAITPWNGPWACNLTNVGAALGAGNTVILKPSPDAPWAATILGRLAAEETDLPPGVLNVVTSIDNMMGEILTTDPRVDMIAFTGSAANGKRIAEVSARTLKRLVLELGGKSPHIVLEGADVAKEAAIAARSICANSGQGCYFRSRLLLPRASYEEGVAAAAAEMAKVTVGDPNDPANFMGPLVSKQHRERVLGLIAEAVEQGNRLVFGGGIPPALSKGWYVEPTLLADVDAHDRIAQEEVFGPVLAVIPYNDHDHALEIANGTPYGLAAYVAAGTENEARAFAERLRSGTVMVNGGEWMHMDVPFGGYKQSGVGRQFGVMGFEEYLEVKVMGIALPKQPTSLPMGAAALVD